MHTLACACSAACTRAVRACVCERAHAGMRVPTRVHVLVCTRLYTLVQAYMYARMGVRAHDLQTHAECSTTATVVAMGHVDVSTSMSGTAHRAPVNTSSIISMALGMQ